MVLYEVPHFASHRRDDKRNAAMGIHVVAAILRVILNHEDEHIIDALAKCDFQHNKTVISS